MTLRCFAYRALDRFRFTALASRLFYRGHRVTVLQPSCTVTGIVLAVSGRATDGDVCFDIQLADGSQRHCEVTPCASHAVRRIAQGLPLGATVRVTGEERYDPAHVGDGGNLGSSGWYEIHPVQQIEVVTWARSSSAR